MRKKGKDRILAVLGKASIQVAKTMVNSTTRYYNYQPEEDQVVYMKMRERELR